MENTLLNELIETYPVALYDMSIEDIEQRKLKRILFATATKAANFLGYNTKKFYERVGPGKYLYHAVTGKQYAARRLAAK